MKPSIHRITFRTAAAALLCGLALPAGAVAPPGRYTIPGDGTVHDNQTGLVWQQTLGDNPNGETWSAAASYCSALGLSGGGWRVPSMKELQTLVDETVGSPSIDTTAFPNAPVSVFWTSSPLAGNPSVAWLVSFNDGSTVSSGVSSTFRVRCVR